MVLKITIGFLLILRCGVGFAQLGATPERSALKSMEKHRWEKAELKLRKTLYKDTLNPSVRYILSTFYFTSDNPAFNVDSAYHYVAGALADYQLTTGRERERLRRIPLDSVRLIRMREKIDSAAFEQVRKTNTEAAYLIFLSHYPTAAQRSLAVTLRDEVAYQDALKENSYQAFLSYLNRYPESVRAGEARSHYDRLLYLAETKDRRLSSFEKFLTVHPETPYRRQIYRNIFELSTADGSTESFLQFMRKYSSCDFVKRAHDLIFHILAEEDNPKWPDHFLTDSLNNLLSMQNTYLVPVLKNGLFGFIDENGKEIIRPAFTNIDPDYLCGNITDDVLMLGTRLVARNGSVIYEGAIEELTELGIGFLKVKTRDGVKVIHKAGFVFADSVQDGRVLNKRFVALKKNDGWRLFSLAGKPLEDQSWDDITAIQNVILFKRDAKFYLTPQSQLTMVAVGAQPGLSEPFDDVKKWPRELIWVRAGKSEGVLDQALQPVMRFDDHRLAQTFFGAMTTVANGIHLYNWAGQEASTFENVNIFGPRVAVEKNQSWFLFEPRLQKMASQGYDSMYAEGPFVIGLLSDTAYVHFAKNKIRIFIQPHRISFVPGKDSTSFLLVEDQEWLKSVFNLKGKKLFSTTFDAIQYAGQGIFVITQKNKNGLINSSGEELLPPEFDAIGSVQDNVVSVLKSKRFGSYNIRKKKLIKPQYDRNIVPYANEILETFKDGYYGFLGWDNKPLSPFEFDEIKYWDDSLALVRKGTLWSFYDIASNQITENNLRNISMIKNSPDEKIAIIQKDNTFGVISNKRNIIIPASFTDIINLGSEDNPLYFTEKNIREASLFIVIYYDSFGKMLRKEIYEDASDYDKIYCSDNQNLIQR